MAGFDTLYDNNFDDGEIADIAAGQHRIPPRAQAVYQQFSTCDVCQRMRALLDRMVLPDR